MGWGGCAETLLQHRTASLSLVLPIRVRPLESGRILQNTVMGTFEYGRLIKAS
jgi:hypothetical protein